MRLPALRATLREAIVAVLAARTVGATGQPLAAAVVTSTSAATTSSARRPASSRKLEQCQEGSNGDGGAHACCDTEAVPTGELAARAGLAGGSLTKASVDRSIHDAALVGS